MLGHTATDRLASNPLLVFAMIAAAVLTVAVGVGLLLRRWNPRPRWVNFGLPMLLGLVVVGAVASRDQWDWLFEDGSVKSEGVVAPTLAPTGNETLYRIAEGSTVSYSVEERLAGSTKTAEGSTDLVAGDVTIDDDDPTAARIGTVVVNVESFESDSTLRDKRIRHDYLESTSFPYASFSPTSVEGLPAEVAEGVDHELTITGDLTVKETTATATFAGTARLDGDTLTAHISTTVTMSSYDVGPISISGLVSTGDEVELSFDLVAVETDPDESPGSLASPAADQITQASGAVDVSFADDVQPVLEAKCASCHTDEGIGQDTFSLATAGDASEVAPDLAMVTGARYMPPWPASDKSVGFEHDWSLSDDEIAMIAAWSESDGVLDVPADTPIQAEEEQVRPIERDHVVAGAPYVGSEEHPDDYRCQIYEIPREGTGTEWLKSFTIEPDREEIVHHAVISLVTADGRASAEDSDAQDPEPGWRCFVGGGVGESRQIAAWAPGQQPVEYPDATGIPVSPGDFIVVQIHYHYDHEFPTDETAIVLDMASDEEVAAAGGAFTPVSYRTYLAPAEIPCTPGEQGPMCDRDAVLARISDEFGPTGAVIPDALLRSCGVELADKLADTDGTGDAACEQRVSNPGEIVGIFGHMHEFGESFRMTLNPGTPEERILLDIPSWSFDWQFDYRPTEKIVVDSQDVIRIECTWRRDLAPMLEPRYITWNQGTGDEMCYSALATVPE